MTLVPLTLVIAESLRSKKPSEHTIIVVCAEVLDVRRALILGCRRHTTIELAKYRD